MTFVLVLGAFVAFFCTVAIAQYLDREFWTED